MIWGIAMVAWTSAYAPASAQSADAPPARTTSPALLIAQAPGETPPPTVGREPQSPASDTGAEPPASGGEQESASPAGAEAPASSGATEEQAGSEQAPWPPEPTDDQLTMSADRVYYYGGATGLQGNVMVRHRGVTIRADVGEIDADHIWGQFRGNVTITGENYSTTVERLKVNFDTSEWIIEGGRTTVSPEYFEQGVVEPIYVRGGTISTATGAEPIEVSHATITTCNLEHPHYGLVTGHATLREDNKLVLRRPALQLFGHTFIRYPWNLVLSADQRNNRFFPEFGQNSIEGYYAKLAYLYLAGDLGDGYVRVFDLFRHVAERVPTQADQHPIFKASAMEEDFPIALVGT